mgnify:CR=1 FL=1
MISADIYGEESSRLQKYLEEIRNSGNHIFLPNWSTEGNVILQFLELKALCEQQLNGLSMGNDIDDFLYRANGLYVRIMENPKKRDHLQVNGISHCKLKFALDSHGHQNCL